MVIYYLDTSALVKRYVNETGSDWLRDLLAPPRDVVVVTTQLLVVEMTSAFNRRVREGTVTASDYARLVGRLRDDCRDTYQLLAPDGVTLDLACALVERYPLRAYDAVHLATALRLHRWLVEVGEAGLTFLSADDRLNAAAAAEGLTVDNPNQHS